MSEPIRIDRRNQPDTTGELREFMLVVRRALLMICAYIERRYGA